MAQTELLLCALLFPDEPCVFLVFTSSRQKNTIVQHDSRRKEAAQHRDPGIRFYVHVHRFSDMRQHRGGLQPLHIILTFNECALTVLSYLCLQQTVLISFNSTDFHGTGYTR